MKIVIPAYDCVLPPIVVVFTITASAHRKRGYRVMNAFHLVCLIKERQRQLLEEDRRNQILMEDKKMIPIKSKIIRIFTSAGIVGMALYLLIACGAGVGTSVSE